MQVEWAPDPDNVYLTSGQDNLALHRAEPCDAGRLDHMGFVVSTEEAVDCWAERVRDYGVAFEQELKTHRDGARSFYFRDPDGTLIQILYHPPLAGLSAGPDPRSLSRG